MTKMRLLAGTAIVAGASLIGSQAMAFDQVEWEWDAYVNTNVDQDLFSTTVVDPTGLVMLQDLQIQIGDVSAYSYVSGITNNPPATEPTDVSFTFQTEVRENVDPADAGYFNETFADGVGFQDPIPLDGYFDDEDPSSPDSADGFENIDSVYFDVSGVDEGQISIQGAHTDAFNGDVEGGEDLLLFTVTIEDIEASPDMYDALDELPEVESVATAVGNNANIESITKTDVHEGQFVLDADGWLIGDDHGDIGDGGWDILGIVGGGVASALWSEAAGDDPNTNLSLAIGLLTASVMGGLEKASIYAESQVWDIENATVDSAATAVANNKSITLDPHSVNNDSVLIADLTQFAYADVGAYSNVSDVTISNYYNLNPDVLGKPIVSSVATAVGNNLSVTVDPGALDD